MRLSAAEAYCGWIGVLWLRLTVAECGWGLQWLMFSLSRAAVTKAEAYWVAEKAARLILRLLVSRAAVGGWGCGFRTLVLISNLYIKNSKVRYVSGGGYLSEFWLADFLSYSTSSLSPLICTHALNYFLTKEDWKICLLISLYPLSSQ